MPIVEDAGIPIEGNDGVARAGLPCGVPLKIWSRHATIASIAARHCSVSEYATSNSVHNFTIADSWAAVSPSTPE